MAGRGYDFAVVGGGLVGAAVAYGLARAGRRVAVLDEGDDAIRASRGNFALVWVQSKGLGLPEYAVWTVGSSKAWPAFAEELRAETGLDVSLQQPGGFHLCLSDAELQSRADMLKRFHNQSGVARYQTEIMDRARIETMLPGLGPDVVGGSFCPLDGHVNSLRLFRALHMALSRMGVAYLGGHRVESIDRQSGGGFVLHGERGPIEAGQVVLAAGNANARLAPMVGLDAPMLPERGQIIVTERVAPFLRHPVVTVRQTDEGTVMIGDSREEGTTSAGTNGAISAMMAARAVRFFPRLAGLNVIRTWRAIRVMPKDGFPIYDQSASHPGAFLVTCHSGVTLAAAHALTLAPMIAAGRLDDGKVGAFSARRFDVQKAA